MKITLADMSTLLRIPIVGQFCLYGMLDFASASSILVELFGVDIGDVNIGIRHSRVCSVRLSWLREVYEKSFIQQRWDCCNKGLHITSSRMHNICR